eukprot:COSAG02_NODE_7845_length_2821_cov_1.299780_2_plen_126_part_00
MDQVERLCKSDILALALSVHLAVVDQVPPCLVEVRGLPHRGATFPVFLPVCAAGGQRAIPPGWAVPHIAVVCEMNSISGGTHAEALAEGDLRHQVIRLSWYNHVAPRRGNKDFCLGSNHWGSSSV